MKKKIAPWLYLLPTIILVILFVAIPFIKVFSFSLLNDYDYINDTYSGIGFSNYSVLFSKNEFLEALKTTLLTFIIATPISIFISLSIAIAMNNIKVLKKVFKAIFVLPFFTNVIAIGYVVLIIFTKNEMSVGLFNWFIGLFGINSIDWINGDYIYKLIVYIAYIVWRLLPFQIILIIGSLQSIKEEYYISARIDGCSRVRQFNIITIPMILPALVFLALAAFVVIFKDLDTSISIFGLNNGFNTLGGYIYSGIGNNTGIVSAASIIAFGIMLLIIFITIIIRKIKEK